MPRGLQILTPPVGEPVSLCEAKQWARIFTPDDDALVQGLIVSARKYVEETYNLSLVSRTYRTTIDRFPRYSSSAVWQYNSDAIWQQRLPVTQLSGQWYPDRASIRLTRPPAQAVLQITYADPLNIGNRLVVDPSVYNVDVTTSPARVAPAYGQIWPIVLQQLASVQTDYVAGYGPVTNLTAAVAAGEQTVTPAGMFGIYEGALLCIDRWLNLFPNLRETVAVTATTPTTFTATFANAHNVNATVEPEMPESVRTAIKLLVAYWYENRELAQPGALNAIPMGVESLLWGETPAEYE